MRFLCGLPRSRTFWFTAYFNGIEGVKAVHEPLNGCKSRQEFYDMVEAEPDTVWVDSGLYLTDWTDRWPDASNVVIHRPVADVCRSLTRRGIVFPEAYQELTRAEAVYRRTPGVHIPYDLIDRSMGAIHKMLTKEPFDPQYAARMADVKLELTEITGDPESYLIWAAGGN